MVMPSFQPAIRKKPVDRLTSLRQTLDGPVKPQVGTNPQAMRPRQPLNPFGGQQIHQAGRPGQPNALNMIGTGSQPTTTGPMIGGPTGPVGPPATVVGGPVNPPPPPPASVPGTVGGGDAGAGMTGNNTQALHDMQAAEDEARARRAAESMANAQEGNEQSIADAANAEKMAQSMADAEEENQQNLADANHNGIPDADETIDDKQNEFINSLYDDVNNVDTTEEERVINEQMQRLMGQGLVGARARGGAAGMASSGAMLAAEGGIRAKSATDTSGQILDARHKAKQQAIENAFGGGESDIALREQDRKEAFDDLLFDFLGIGDANQPEGVTIDTDGDGENSPEEIAAAAQRTAQSMSNAEEGNKQSIADAAEEQAAVDEEAADNASVIPGQNKVPTTKPPDANTYSNWTGNDPPWGFRTGQDDEFFYVVGLDGKRWKVPRY